MVNNPLKLFFTSNMEGLEMSKDDIAKLLKTTPEALETFEKTYQTKVLPLADDDDNLFGMNAKQMAGQLDRADIAGEARALNDRIIAELLAQTPTCTSSK